MGGRPSIEPPLNLTNRQPAQMLSRSAILSKRSYAMAIPDDPNALLTREDTAKALTAFGFPTTRATLATKASRGAGPKFRKFGPRPLYRWADAVEWARSRLGPVVSTTAELDMVSRKATPSRSTAAANTDLPAAG